MSGFGAIVDARRQYRSPLRCLPRGRSGSRRSERRFVSLGLDPQSEADPAGNPLTASPKGEGGASPLQTPNALREEHIMKKTVLAALGGVILAAFGVLSADAQDLKAMLLKATNGWVIEWFSPSSLDKGVTEAMFEDRGGKVVAKLYIAEMSQETTAFRGCERDVVIAADAISFDGCRDQNMVLIRDPSDKVYPLKTKTKTVAGYDWKLKER
jgi:hypothetical protein